MTSHLNRFCGAGARLDPGPHVADVSAGSVVVPEHSLYRRLESTARGTGRPSLPQCTTRISQDRFGKPRYFVDTIACRIEDEFVRADIAERADSILNSLCVAVDG